MDVKVLPFLLLTVGSLHSDQGAGWTGLGESGQMDARYQGKQDNRDGWTSLLQESQKDASGRGDQNTQVFRRC